MDKDSTIKLTEKGINDIGIIMNKVLNKMELDGNEISFLSLGMFFLSRNDISHINKSDSLSTIIIIDYLLINDSNSKRYVSLLKLKIRILEQLIRIGGN